MRTLLVSAFCAQVFCFEICYSQCVEREYDPPTPTLSHVAQDDFERNTLYLQNMQIWGNRLFGVEDAPGSSGPSSDIIVGNHVINPSLNDTTGDVVITVGYRLELPIWQSSHTYATNDRISGRNGHAYKAITSGTTGSNVWDHHDMPEWAGGTTTNHKPPFPSGTMPIWNINMVSGGNGYNAPPYTVTFSPTGATAQILASDISGGVVTHISAPPGGYGGAYAVGGGATPPSVIIPQPCPTCSTAVATADLDWHPYTEPVEWQEDGRVDVAGQSEAYKPWGEPFPNPSDPSWTPSLYEMRKPTSASSSGAGHLYRVIQRWINTGDSCCEPDWYSYQQTPGCWQPSGWTNSITNSLGGVPSVLYKLDASPNYLALGWSHFSGQNVGWSTVWCHLDGDLVRPSSPNGFVYRVLTTGDLAHFSVHGPPASNYGTTEPNWSAHTTYGEIWKQTTSSGDIAWKTQGKDATGQGTTWSGSTKLLAGTLIAPTSGYISSHLNSRGLQLYYAHVPQNNYWERGGICVTNTSEPTWPSGHNATKWDGDYILWQECGVEAGDVDFRATRSVQFEHGFEAKEGCRFHAYIKPQFCDHPTFDETWTYSDGSGTHLKSTNFTSTTDPTDAGYLWHLDNGPTANLSIHSDGTLWMHSPATDPNFPWGGKIQIATNQTMGPFGYYEEIGQPASQDGELGGSSFWMNSCHCGEGDIRALGIADPLGGSSYLGWDEIDVYDGVSRYPGASQNNVLGHSCRDYLPTWGGNWLMSPEHTNMGFGWTHYYGGQSSTTPYAMNSDVSFGDDLSHPSTTFHKFALEWLPHEIRFLVDGRVLERTPKLGTPYYPDQMYKQPVTLLLHNSSGFDSYHVVKEILFRAMPGSCPTHKEANQTSTQAVEKKIDFSFSVSPNPTQNELHTHLELGGDVFHSVSIRLFDVLGHVVRIIYDGQAKNIFDVSAADVGKLPSGPYYCVCAIDGGMRIITRKLEVIR